MSKDNLIAKTSIVLTKEQLKQMLKNAEVGGLSEVLIDIKYEVIIR
jgi:hypothetical protein